MVVFLEDTLGCGSLLDACPHSLLGVHPPRVWAKLAKGYCRTGSWRRHLLTQRSRGHWNQKEEQFQELCGRLEAQTAEHPELEIVPEVSHLRSKLKLGGRQVGTGRQSGL